ncbi:unknown protein [Seminavis robusta]|uniref:BspA family leucine-rich repeat surface protein n=1 Tax=Seminavis robusta TaxID=568900 RepID=A0A9N8H2D8_9STRA|nr:unknown protein [Seminavis robusta]|eukprot:Sro34_g021840.1 n/a (495) ;mRNA; r:18856-20639
MSRGLNAEQQGLLGRTWSWITRCGPPTGTTTLSPSPSPTTEPPTPSPPPTELHNCTEAPTTSPPTAEPPTTPPPTTAPPTTPPPTTQPPTTPPPTTEPPTTDPPTTEPPTTPPPTTQPPTTPPPTTQPPTTPPPTTAPPTTPPPTTQTPTGPPTCAPFDSFTTREELQDAITQVSDRGNVDDSTLPVFCKYGHPMGTWNVSRVTSFHSIFLGYRGFSYNLNGWDTKQVTNLDTTFGDGSFNGAVDQWDTSNVIEMGRMFQGNGLFSGDLSRWATGKVTGMKSMMQGNRKTMEDLVAWDVSKVHDFWGTFASSGITANIGGWDVGNGKVFKETFDHARGFNIDISRWDTKNMETAEYMFRATPFNQPIGAWDTSKLYSTIAMFANTPFDQDLCNWDVRRVLYAQEMFVDSAMTHDLSCWCFESLIYGAGMFWFARNYNHDLCAWRRCLPSYTNWNVTVFNQLDHLIFTNTMCPQPFIPNNNNVDGPFCHACLPLP